jgi:hypothetical protein
MTESNNLLSQTYLESIIDQYKSLYEGIRELIYVKYQYEYSVIFTHALFTQRTFILYNEVELHFKKLDTSSFNPIDFSIFQPIYSINAEIGKVANPSDDLSSINDRIIYYLNVAAYLKSQELLKTETDIIHRRYYDYHLSELERWFDNRHLYLAKVKATFNIQTIIQEKVIPFKEIKALLAKIENKDEISLPKYPNSEPKTEPVPEVLPDQGHHTETPGADTAFLNEDRVARAKVKELSVQNRALKKQLTLKHDPDPNYLQKLIDQARHPKTNRFSYRKLGKLLGCTHSTAKSIVKRNGLEHLTA